MWCSFRGCGVSILDGVLKNRTGINIQDELLVYRMEISKRHGMLVNGMGCYFPGWGVRKRDGVVLSGMGY